ncbi:AAA domain-containing protein [Desulfovibrio sp.]|uniref:AAA domain-containing protein n=1 Tax=Desulfovibrio sp. TaxID=885 RepID=UPI0025C344C8|nr:AAA domain-containing protein [Desulfovibrio sp.]
MIFPLLAILGTVTISATALAWLYEQETEREQERQRNLKKEFGKLQEEFARYSEQKDGVPCQALIYSQGWIELLKVELAQLAQKVAPIENELNRILPLVLAEAKEPTTDTFRRNMLKRELLRFDDAKRKLDAYLLYIKWFEEKLSKLALAPSSSDLFSLSLPSVTLPEFWLYPGKLVMLPIDMLGKALPDFGHSILLHNLPSRQIQQMYFTPPGQEASPVLIERQNRDRPCVFWGCALKGAFFLKHVLDSEPTTFRISRGGSTYYQGSMFEGKIHAILPRDNMFSPGLNRREGDTLNVYPEEFDLLLQHNYTGRFELKGGNTLPIVSEIPCYRTTVSQLNPLFLLLESSKYEESVCKILDDASEPFYLLDATVNEDRDSVSIKLSKGGLVLSCRVDPQGWLEMEDIISNSLDFGAGIDLPILIIPAEKERRKALLPSADGLILLESFIERLRSLEKRQQSALAMSSFFDNWMQVLTFLQEEEGEQELEFPATIPAANDLGEFLLPLSSLAENPHDDIENFWEVFDQECDLNPQKEPILSYWITKTTGDGYWKRLQTESISRTSDNCTLLVRLRNRVMEGFSAGTDSLFKLSFRTMQYVPLERQKNALKAMRDDRLANSELRDALLLPNETFYKPAISKYWKERLEAEAIWSLEPNKLSANQKEVVRTCLSVDPLTIVQGPPGTGKTRCILEIVYQFLSHNPTGRVLISSQQNTAVDNVIERLVQHQQDFLEANSISIMRIGNEEKMSLISQQFTFNEHLRKITEMLSVNAEDASTNLSLVQSNWGKSTPGSGTNLNKMDNITLRKRLRDFLQPKLSKSGIDNEMLFCMTAGCQIVAATCVGLANKAAAMDQCRFDLAIIDEAGRATPPELLIPMKLAKKVVLIGDHCQLPPAVNPLLRDESAQEALPFLKETFLDNSYFGTLFDSLPESARCRLTEQYRMDNAIGDLVAELFYTENGERRLYNGLQEIKAPGYVRWIDVKGTHKRVGTSLYNEIEGQKTLEFLEFLDEKSKIKEFQSVAVITPYREQKKLLRKVCSNKTFNNLKSVNINTVDQFQGSEADIVIYSTVRSKGPIDFLLDKKRLNVACSRARHALFFIGNKDVFMKKNAGGPENIFSRIFELTSG